MELLLAYEGPFAKVMTRENLQGEELLHELLSCLTFFILGIV